MQLQTKGTLHGNVLALWNGLAFPLKIIAKKSVISTCYKLYLPRNFINLFCTFLQTTLTQIFPYL